MNTIKGIFKQLWQLLPRSSKKPTGKPLNLQQRHITALRELRQSKHWKEYTEVLDSYIHTQAEAMLGCSRNEDLHFLRGTIFGLRQAAMIVDNLIQGEENKNERREQSAADELERRSAALYGTGFWGNARN